jgi:hypothetical protein
VPSGSTRYVWINRVQVCGDDSGGLHCVTANGGWGERGIASFEATAHAPD